MKILFIDPGSSKASAWALFEGVVLKEVGVGRRADFLGDRDPTIDKVVIEKPEIYPHSKVRPNDIVDLAFSAGLICGLMRVPYEIILPKIWKGQLPKKVCWARAQAKLTPSEQAIITEWVQHWGTKQIDDIQDAIALGLWYLKR